MEVYVVPRIGGTRLDAITSADLTRLYADLLREAARGGRALAPKTVRHVHTRLRRALADAVEGRHIPYNPAAAAKVAKLTPSGEPAAWMAAETSTFLRLAAGDRLAALWTLAATTGMRRGELLGLRWADVDLDAARPRASRSGAVIASYGKLQLEKEPKTARSRRTIPLPARSVAGLRTHRVVQAAERLAAGPAYSDEGWVFADEIGEPLSPNTITYAFGRLVRSTGLRPITLHGLRHTWATMALVAGVDVLYVAEVLGHSTPAITMSVYQHARPERTAGALDRVADALTD